MALSPEDLKQLEALEAQGQLAPAEIDALNVYRSSVIQKTPKGAAPAPTADLTTDPYANAGRTSESFGFDPLALPFGKIGAGMAELPSAEEIGGDIMHGARYGVAPAIGPTGLGMAGFAAGTALGGPGLGIVGEAGGNMVGEFLNQQLGLTEPSTAGVLTAGAMPPAARGLTKLAKQSYRALPGASAALNEEGVEAARKIPTTHIGQPATSSDVLFDRLDQLFSGRPPTIGMQRTVAHVNKLMQQQRNTLNSFQNPRIYKIWQDIRQRHGFMTIDEIRNTASQLNQEIGAAINAGDGPLEGALNLVKKGFHEDLEYAIAHGGATGPGLNAQWGQQGAAILKEAWKAKRMEETANDLARIIEKKGINPGGEMMDTINANAIWKAIKNNDYLMASLTPSEQTAIRATLDEIGKIPAIQVRRGQPIGSGRRLTTTGLMGAAGYHFTQDPTKAAAIAWAVDKGSEQLAHLLMSPKGRWFVRRLFRASQGNFGEREAAAMASYLQATTGAGTPAGETVLNLVGD